MISTDLTNIWHIGALCTAENLRISHCLITRNAAPQQPTPRDVLGWHGFDWDFRSLQVCLIFGIWHLTEIYIQISLGYVNLCTLEAWFEVIALGMHLGAFKGFLSHMRTIRVDIRLTGALGLLKLYVKNETEMWAHLDLMVKDRPLGDEDFMIFDLRQGVSRRFN